VINFITNLNTWTLVGYCACTHAIDWQKAHFHKTLGPENTPDNLFYSLFKDEMSNVHCKVLTNSKMHW